MFFSQRNVLFLFFNFNPRLILMIIHKHLIQPQLKPNPLLTCRTSRSWCLYFDVLPLCQHKVWRLGEREGRADSLGSYNIICGGSIIVLGAYNIIRGGFLVSIDNGWFIIVSL